MYKAGSTGRSIHLHPLVSIKRIEFQALRRSLLGVPRSRGAFQFIRFSMRFHSESERDKNGFFIDTSFRKGSTIAYLNF
jgi:hypothetical protein